MEGAQSCGKVTCIPCKVMHSIYHIIKFTSHLGVAVISRILFIICNLYSIIILYNIMRRPRVRSRWGLMMTCEMRAVRVWRCQWDKLPLHHNNNNSGKMPAAHPHILDLIYGWLSSNQIRLWNTSRKKIN